jgi:hypothetical protein
MRLTDEERERRAKASYALVNRLEDAVRVVTEVCAAFPPSERKWLLRHLYQARGQAYDLFDKYNGVTNDDDS